MTIGEFVTYFQSELAHLEWYDKREVRSMASYLLKELAGVESYKLIVDPQMELEPSVGTALMGCLAKMKKGEPLQYALGYEYFCGHKFSVAPGVLIPRPETEELVNLILSDTGCCVKAQEPLKVLDICTGSGCIAWSLASGLPGSRVYGCDISDEALAIARSQNIAEVKISSEISFFKCDILDAGAGTLIKGMVCDSNPGFDIIVSNPPYVCDEERCQMRANVLDYEPELALFVPDDDPLKFYRRIVELSAGRRPEGRLEERLEGGSEDNLSGILKRGGLLYFEVNERFAAEVVALMQSAGFTECQIVCDMFGKERMVKGRRDAASADNKDAAILGTFSGDMSQDVCS
ncbi:MAG: peptide chain release factor N(5)-glutamine methyltransferase [Bacteroidales bacterium]|nr:peptide chain release factor N(5)-glutamine methyltransferase [Bacteroidales bacterium]